MFRSLSDDQARLVTGEERGGPGSARRGMLGLDHLCSKSLQLNSRMGYAASGQRSAPSSLSQPMISERSLRIWSVTRATPFGHSARYLLDDRQVI